MQDLKDILEEKKKGQQELFDSRKYISREFQDYGLRLAGKLNDMKHKALYIKLAKEKPRALLDQAFSFTTDYPGAKNKGKIFMWKLKELTDERKEKKKEEKDGKPKEI